MALSMGSSPLARGTPAQFHGATARFGLIPARAGNTKQGMQANVIMGAHPRSRGEHIRSEMPLSSSSGSSPLARGTLHL